MYGNGVMIGMLMITMRDHRKITQKVHLPADIAFCMAVLGTSILGSVGLPIVSGTTRTAGTTATVSGWFGLLGNVYGFYGVHQPC